MRQYHALSARIREGLSEIERVVCRAKHLADRAIQSNDDDYWDGVALNLHGFYAGSEKIFEDIASNMDESVPSGSDWHRDLLLQITSDLPNIRPSVLRRETRQCLEEYRGFRHVVRNIYSFNLRPARLKELVDDLDKCFSHLKDDLLAFTSFLEKI
jgi:hypothetical protein